MGCGCSSAEAIDASFRVLVPVRCSQTGKRRYEIYSSVVLYAACKSLDFRRRLDDSETVTKPLYYRTCHEDAAFEGIIHLVPDLPCDSCKEIVRRHDRPFAAVHEHEASGSICVLHRSRLCTHLSEKGSLLVSGDTCDRDFMGKESRFRVSVHLA